MDIMQKEAFLSGEGDRWFGRNTAGHLPHTGEILRRVLSYLPSDQGLRILEVGCGDGRNLAWIKSHIPCEVWGIEPSSHALAKAQEVIPDGCFIRGTADELAGLKTQFDLVYFGFCLYLVDRESLAKVVQETRAVLKERGIVAISDFDSKFPYANAYVHRQGLRSYKMDYGSLFDAHEDFHLVEKFPWSHQGMGLHLDQNEWCATSILQKGSFRR